MISPIQHSEIEKYMLATCSLADATMMGTFRDGLSGLSYDAKNIYLDHFAFYIFEEKNKLFRGGLI